MVLEEDNDEEELNKGKGKSDSSSDEAAKGKGNKGSGKGGGKDGSILVSMGMGYVHMTPIQWTTTAIYVCMALLAVLWCALRPVSRWANEEYEKIGGVPVEKV